VGELDSAGNGGFKSDFSPGWNLNILSSGVTVSHPKGTTTQLDQAFAKGTRVMVTLPSGEVHRFTFSPVPLGNVFVPRLSPDPEFKSELYLKDVDQNVRLIENKARNDGTYLTANGDKESIPSNFGTEWILKTQNGLEYHFDLLTGSLLSIQSSAGASIDIQRSADGQKVTILTRNTGPNNEDADPNVKKVVINRELRPGSSLANPDYRVVSIEDAVVEAGQDRRVLYRYGDFNPTTGAIANDTKQNLAQVESLNGEKSSYGYTDINLQRSLTKIYDNARQAIFTASYFSDVDNSGSITSLDREDVRFGRLSTTINANGAPTNFGFDFSLGDGKKVRSTNNGVNTIEQVLDGRGNTIRVVTLVDDNSDDTAKRYIASVTRYNLRGLVIGQSKPFYIVGAANRFTQEPADPATNRLAWTQLTTYDSQDRKLTVSDAAGGVTVYSYDDDKGLQTTTDPHGITAVRHIAPSNGQLIETYTTNTKSATRLDHVTYEYDTFGNQTRQWLNLSNGTRVLASQAYYNADGFLAWNEQLGSPRQFFAYDENGQQTHSWQNIPSSTIAGQFTAVVKYQFNNYAGEANPFATSGSGNGGLGSAEFEIVGNVLYDDSNVPALLAKLATFQTPGSGVTKTSESNSTKNARDQVVETRTLSLDSSGNAFWYLSRSIYDSAGRVEFQTETFRSDTPTTEISGTHNYYDTQGRVWKTEQVKGLNISVSSPQIGIGESSLVSSGTVQSYATTSFNALGRAVSSTQ
ncbi:MAG: hypothetical protein ACK6DC_02710, partial [Planctomycetota bacterium]